jgi:hypothetical protein
MKNKIVWITVVLFVLAIVSGITGYLVGFNTRENSKVAGISASPLLISTQEASLSINQSTTSGAISESEQLVNSFYRWYINCLNQKDNCNYDNRPEVNFQKITSKTREVSGYDRLLCAQNVPQFFQIDHSTKDGDGVESVYVVETFESGQVQFIAEVESTSQEPKIINVICPRP